MMTEADMAQLKIRNESPVTIADDAQIIAILNERDGLKTHVLLTSGEFYSVHNIVYGYDIGDPYAHITANIGPSIAGESVHFFHTYAVLKLTTENDEELFTVRSGR
jgi:hypothetical protein